MQDHAHSQLHEIVSALVRSLASDRLGDPRLAPPYEDVTQFILRESARMSGLFGCPLAALTHGFNCVGVLRQGRRFQHQADASQRKQIEAWRNSALSFRRDFIRFYESLAMLALYSREQRGQDAEKVDAASCRVPKEERGEDAASAFLRCEVAVIGSGPGGSITACLLAEAGRDVIMLEEGPFLPLGSCALFSKEEMEQKYRNGGLTVALGRTKVAYAEGRCVGGGSEINSGLYHRTPPDILGEWRREFDVEALNEADLRPHFEACEHDVSVSPLRGPALVASLKLHDAATGLGWKSLEVPRCFSYAPTPPGETPRGARQSMTRTYVPRFLSAGGRLLPGTRVGLLARDGARWRLDARHETRGELRISADAVFVCGGAVQTPALLRRSGFRGNIGNSLRLHPTVKLVARFPEPVNAAGPGVPVHQVKEFAPRLSLGCSISTPPQLALGLLDHPEAARRVSSEWRHFAVYYAAIAGDGSGTVRNLPGIRDPLIRYRLTDSDHRDLADGLAKLAEAVFAAGASEIYPGLPGGMALRHPGEVRKLPGAFPRNGAGLMTLHLFASCPMGERAARCAADSFGRVHGAPNLHIADASLLCGAPGVNPQGTIMALARRNALRYLGRT